MSEPVIQVRNISKVYRLGRADPSVRSFREAVMETVTSPIRRLRETREITGGDADAFWALRDVSFDIQQGEVVGLIGRNGAGKSTLLKVLSRITEPTSGRVKLRGRVGSLLEVGTGFHPELTGRENVYLNGAILGMRKKEIDRKFDEIIAFAEIEQFLDTPVKRYSSGMYVRLAFAVAAHLDPEILIVDEVLAVGDADFQRKCLRKMDQVAHGGRTIVFVSHNMAAIRSLCHRAILLKKGAVVDSGAAAAVVDRYMNSSVDDDRCGEAVFARPSGGKLWMAHASVLADGEVASQVPMGAEISLHVGFEADPGIAQPRLGFVISTLEGTRLLCANNRYQEARAFDHSVSQGMIECNLGSVPLMAGTYTCSLFLGDAASDTHVELDALQFTVIERDLWGLGTVPPAGVSPLWWPAKFTCRQSSEGVMHV